MTSNNEQLFYNSDSHLVKTKTDNKDRKKVVNYIKQIIYSRVGNCGPHFKPLDVVGHRVVASVEVNSTICIEGNVDEPNIVAEKHVERSQDKEPYVLVPVKQRCNGIHEG